MIPKGQGDQVKLSRETRRCSTRSIPGLDMGHALPGPHILEVGGRSKDMTVTHCCSKMRLRIEREDGGNLLIGGMSLANNCQAILVIFGFFFIFAGVVLTVISYKTPLNSTVSETSATREQGKVTGPLFLVVGSVLFVVGTILSLVNWRLHREAKIQRNRFSIEGLPVSRHSSSGLSEDASTNFFQKTRKLSRASTVNANASSSFPNSRRESLFPSNYFMGRRRTLPTISQAVPLGFLIDGKVEGFRRNFPPNSAARIEEDGGQVESTNDTSRRKASLTLRASLPMPLLSPNFMRVRSLTPDFRQSDEPFGSIASLSGTGDIACFPAQSLRYPQCRQEGMSPAPFPLFHSEEHPGSVGLPPAYSAFQNILNPVNATQKRELPVITINDTVDPLMSTKGHGRMPSLCLKTPPPSTHAPPLSHQTPPPPPAQHHRFSNDAEPNANAATNRTLTFFNASGDNAV